MRFTNCPKCDERLKAPDNSGNQAFRCPICKHTFKIDVQSAGAGGQEDSQPSWAGGNGDAADYVPGIDVPSAHGRIMLDADEAMLRDFGNGAIFSPPKSSPLPTPASSPSPSLSMPSSIPPLPPSRQADAVPAAEDDRPNPPADAVPPLPAQDEPFQGRLLNMGSDLRMSQRLIEVYKAELARMRRISLLAWIAVTVISAVTAGVFWWGMTMAAQAGIERANVANLAGQQVIAGKAMDKAASELEAIRADLRKAQADIQSLREALEVIRSDGQKALAEATVAHEISLKGISLVNAFTASLETGISRLSAAASQPGPTAQSAPGR